MSNSTGFGILQGPAAPPASETETKLARLWAELLSATPSDLHDDYFALGGNSLLAVNLFVRVEAQFGVKLPLTSIIEAPTVAQLRPPAGGPRFAQSHGADPRGGDEPPLFLVHDAEGETVIYRSLALHLDPGRAVYGLQPAARPTIRSSTPGSRRWRPSTSATSGRSGREAPTCWGGCAPAG